MADPVETFETPGWSKVLRDAIEARLCDLHTGMPGEIVDYDASTQTATVQPMLKRKYVAGEVVSLPAINKVPVIFPRTRTAYMHLPLARGDTVMLLFSERSIDTWKTIGGTVDPNDPRKHALSDAVAIPGLFPQLSPITPSPGSNDLVLGNLVTKITIKPSGKVAIENPVGELIALESQLLDAISTGTIATLLGPQILLMPTFPVLKALFDTFKV